MYKAKIHKLKNLCNLIQNVLFSSKRLFQPFQHLLTFLHLLALSNLLLILLMNF